MSESVKVVYFVPTACEVFGRQPNQRLKTIMDSDFVCQEEDMIIIDKAERMSGNFSLVEGGTAKGCELIMAQFNKEHAVMIGGNAYRKLIFRDRDVYLIKVDGKLWRDKEALRRYIVKHKHDWAPCGEVKRKELTMEVGKVKTKFIALMNIRVGTEFIDEYTTFKAEDFKENGNDILIDGQWFELGKHLAKVKDKEVEIQSMVRKMIDHNMRSHVMAINYKGSELRHILPLELIEDSEKGDKVRAFQLDGDSTSGQTDLAIKTFFIHYISIAE